MKKTRRNGDGHGSNAESRRSHSPLGGVRALNDHSEVFPLPSGLTLRVRTKRTKQDREAEALVRALITECGKDSTRVLAVIPRADWPPTEDAPGFNYPQLVVQGVYWKGLRAIQAYVVSMRSGIAYTR